MNYQLSDNKRNYFRLIALSFIFSLVLTSLSFAQTPGGKRGNKSGRMQMNGIAGMIIDAKSDNPIEYATIILFNKADSSKVDGTSSNEKGRFFIRKVEPGEYYLLITFLGYELKTIDSVSITESNKRAMLGQIALEPTAVTLSGIDVNEKKASIEYKIDKKIINVSEQLTATSGTAVDILENAPSVNVDIEGNVSLRGSSNFTLLIDGKPSVLDPSDALEQIPASTIDNIEIITNPSAKYDPDGTSGIINIVLKHNSLLGMSGMTDLNLGQDDKYGGSLLLNYRAKKYSAIFQIDYNKRNYPGTNGSENITTFGGTTSYLNSSGSSIRGRESFGIRSNIDLYLSKNDILSFGLRYGDRDMNRSSSVDFSEWTLSEPNHINYFSDNLTLRSGNFYSVSSDYRHKFAKKGHELSAQLIVSRRDMSEELTTSLFDSTLVLTEGSIATEEGPSNQIRSKLDYKLPLKGSAKIEAGYQSRLGRAEDINAQSNYNPISGLYEINPLYNHHTDYNRNIHSLYFMYSNESGKFGYQGGLRGEYTLREIDAVESGENFKIDRVDYFPTMHLSYKFAEGKQMMTSYTRRIKRARGWFLEPFESWSDPYNVRIGNPELKPEYIDSYELGYNQFFGQNMFSTELYYRITNNKVEFIRSVYDTNVTLSSIENVGKDYAFGTEFMLNINQIKFWDMNLMVNLYNYKVEGELDGADFSYDDFTWNARFNNMFSLSNIFKLQVNGMYRSGSVTSQGERTGFFTSNIALRADFMERMLTATLQVQGLFGASKHESISRSTDFYKYSFSERDTPTIMFNLSYNFNNYKQDRRSDRNGSDMGEDDF